MKKFIWGQVVWFKISILFESGPPKEIMIYGKVVGVFEDVYTVRYHSPKRYEEVTQEFKSDKLFNEA